VSRPSRRREAGSTRKDEGAAAARDRVFHGRRPEPGQEYTIIHIPLERPLGRGEMDVIRSIETEYGNNGFYFEVRPDSLLFYLKALDFSALESGIDACIQKVASDGAQNSLDTGVFRELMQRIRGIRSYGIKGGKRIYGRYNTERKVEGRRRKAERRVSYYYARGNQFKREENAVPERLLDCILTGDSEAVLKELPPNCIDLIFTSPPYNFGLGYDIVEDGIHWERYFSKLFAIFDECIRVLKFGGRIIVNIQPLFSDYIPSHHIISQHFMKRKLIWKGEILWEKHNFNCKYCAWGSWKSPSSPYLKYTWEFLEVFCKGDIKKAGEKEKIDITDEEFKRWVVARWSIAPERGMGAFDHPAMFPEELAERVLKLFSYEGDIILDPFNGTGTTTTVAKKWKRRYIGIDTSEKYCLTARKRLEETG
jgi:DNA modification methylase